MPVVESFRAARSRGQAGLCRSFAGLRGALGVAFTCGLVVAASPAARAQPAPAASAAEATLNVLGFVVDGNTLLPPADVERRLEPFKGRATLARLRDAAAAVQEMYRAAGYGGVVAYLPEQDLGSSSVRIRVVEGRLATIDLKPGERFGADNLRASVPSLQIGQTPRVQRIDSEIQMANENPAKTLQVLLQPGAEPGTIAAQLSVVEQPVLRFTARVDNSGTEQNGRWRAAVGFQHANLFDADHVFATEWQTAPEDARAFSVVAASYRAPLYAQHVVLDAYGAWSDVDAGRVGTQAGDLVFAGRGSVAGARAAFYLPRADGIDQRVLAGVEWREYRNTCAIDGLPQGSCGAAGETVALLPVGVTYTAQAAAEWRWGFSVGAYVNAGKGIDHGSDADFEAVRAGARSGYGLLRANAQLGAPVAAFGGAFAARAGAQFAAKPLVPGEMFGIGGATSVRGYEERELLGDSGLQLGLEFSGANHAERFAWLAGGELRGLLFTDFGWVANRDGYACLPGRTRCTLASLGAGLRLGWQQLAARLDVAAALKDAAITRSGDVRVHFALSYNY